MTSSTEDLRERIDHELDLLGPGPDLIATVTARGAAKVRRRRAAVGATLAVVAVTGGVFASGSFKGGAEPGPDRDEAVVAGDPDPAPPVPGPLDDGHVTPAEWSETVQSALAAALPERYGAVAPLENNPFDVDYFSTEGGQPRLQAAVSIGGWLKIEDPALRESEQSCDAINQMRELHQCAQASFGDGWFAVATVDLLPPGNRGPFIGRTTLPPHDPANPPENWSYGTVLTVMNDGIQAELHVSELGWDQVEDGGPAGISVEELVTAAQEPEFIEMLRVGAQWFYDKPAPAPVFDRRTGEEIPSLLAENQDRPVYVR